MPASVGPLALRICSWLVVGAIAAVPVASLVIGSTLAWRSVGLMLSGARMDAIVVDVEISSSNQGKALYSPIVRYSCGEVDTVGQSGISSNERYEPGQHVYVYCDPAAPERFIMDTFGEKYLGMIFMVPGLLLLAVVGGTALRRSRRKKLRHA